MEFHFLFPGLEKSWNLTPCFGKFIKVMEIIKNLLVEPDGLVILLYPAHQHRDIDMSSMKIEIDFKIFVITFCINWLKIIQKSYSIWPLVSSLLVSVHVSFMPENMEKVLEFSASIMEKSRKKYCNLLDIPCTSDRNWCKKVSALAVKGLWSYRQGMV